MTSTARTYTSRRANIVNALATKFKTINGSGRMLSDVEDNVFPFLKFWDEVEEFPAIHLNAGSETREYQGGGYKDRFLAITVRCYVNEENAKQAEYICSTSKLRGNDDFKPIVESKICSRFK